MNRPPLTNGFVIDQLEGRAAAEGQDAAPMAEACGGGRAPDGHNPEVVPPV